MLIKKNSWFDIRFKLVQFIKQPQFIKLFQYSTHKKYVMIWFLPGCIYQSCSNNFLDEWPTLKTATPPYSFDRRSCVFSLSNMAELFSIAVLSYKRIMIIKHCMTNSTTFLVTRKPSREWQILSWHVNSLKLKYHYV